MKTILAVAVREIVWNTKIGPDLSLPTTWQMVLINDHWSVNEN